jgi:hypothetical protein
VKRAQLRIVAALEIQLRLRDLSSVPATHDVDAELHRLVRCGRQRRERIGCDGPHAVGELDGDGGFR